MIKLKKLLKEWNDESFKLLPKRWSKPVMKGSEPDGLTEFERLGGKDKIDLNEMDYQKLIPIQISNIVSVLSRIKQANALGKTKAVKKYYMDAFKLFKSVKKSIDNL